MDIILDTNALYYFSGFSKIKSENINLLKLVDIIEKSDNVYISSVTIYEAINYFKRRAAYIRRLFTFIKNHHIQILSQDLLPTNDIDVDTIRIINQSDLTLLYQRFIAKKIQIETDYSVVILNLLIVTYQYFYITKQNPAPIEKFSKMFFQIASISTKVNQNILKELFLSGYDTKNCDGYIKNAFYDLLEFNLQEYIPLIAPLCKATSDQEIDDTLNNYHFDSVNNASARLRNKIRKHPTTVKYIQSYLKLYEKNAEKGYFKSFLEQFVFPNTSRIPSEALRLYINESIERMIISGCAFHKNDITDRLIIDQITEARDVITFDAGAKDFLKRNAKVNPNYLRSFELSISLTKEY